MIENSTAVIKEFIYTPGTMYAASMTNPAFITNEKRPRVTIVIGKVRMLTIGLMNVFMIPKTTARTKMPTHVAPTPGSMYAAIAIATAEVTRCMMPICQLSYHDRSRKRPSYVQ